MGMRLGLAMGMALLLTAASARAETSGTDAATDGGAAFAPEHEAREAFGDDGGKRAGRFTLGVLGGAVGGGALAAGAFALTCAANHANGWCFLPGMVLGGVLAVTVGIPLGAWVTGYLLDGDGSFVATLGGTLAGSLALYGFATAMQQTSLGRSGATPYLSIAGLTLPLIGAALAYELTSSTSRRAAALEGRRRLTLAPSPLPGGGGLALAGAF